MTHYLVRAGRAVVDAIEGLVHDIADDTLVQRGLEADLGLPEGALDRAKAPRPELTGVDEYINDVGADAEKLAVAVESIKAYASFWTTVFDAAATEDGSVVADEALYRLFQYATVDLMKYEQPNAYAFMRLLGVVTYDVRTALEESFAPEVAGSLFSREYWEGLPAALKDGYHNFRLDQAPDFVRGDPDEAETEEERTRLRQLDDRVFAWSDAGFAGLAFLFMVRGWTLGDRTPRIEQLYGWETPRRPTPPPCLEPPAGTGIPLPDHIASRAHTTRVSTTAGTAKTSATVTQLLFQEADGRLGWLLSLRGAVAFEEKAGSAERPQKITVKVEARDGLDAAIRFSGDDRFTFEGAPTGAMRLAIAPTQPATVGPALALPDATGTRLEIGDFSFSVDLSPAGFTMKAAAARSAFVIATREGDAFVREALGSGETRVEFDLGLTANQDGVSVDGGGRLATTISLNRSVGPVTVQTVQLALNPAASERASELQWSALGSFALKLGPLHVTVEQIGATLDLGSSRDGAPADATELIPSLLYARNLGFRPPSGVGIRVDSELVTGGGFLFHDRATGEYAGVLQLDVGRFALTAIGLLTTRLPEGGEGYSFLIILSLELDPPWRIGPLSLSGLGGLFGLRRALDTDALRSGLRNHALDAILFPQDPVANAGRLVAALRTVFPPTRDKHVAGPILRLGWGTPTLVSAELALVFEWGASSRRALMGQLHAAFPPDRDPQKPGRKILQLHIDAVGIWDSQRGDFSLDATLYDSHLAFATLSGDVAIRMRSGADPIFLFSIGGYHPEFAAPAGFPKLERLKIKLADSKNFRLILSGYLAVTSNTRQVGALVDFFASGKGVSFEARISFDALWELDVRFVIDFDVEFKITYKGMTLFGVSVAGRFTGPDPKRVQGEWSVDLWLVSIGGPFDFTLGDDRPPAALPTADPLPPLVAALADARNWSAPLPAQSRMLVSLRNRSGADEVLIHPLGELGVRQQVLPLGLELARFGGGVPTGERRFTITGAFLGDDPVTDVRSTNEHFAAGEFLELSDDERLHRPSFEEMPAGVTLSPTGLGFGGQAPGTEGHAAVSDIDFEEIVVDAEGEVVRDDAPRPLSPPLTLWAVGFGPAARSPLRAAGAERYAVPGAGLEVGPERFAVAGVDDLMQAPVDGAQAGRLSHAAVAQALERHLREHPQERGALQVVPAFRAEVPA